MWYHCLYQIEGGQHAMEKKPFVVPTLKEEASLAEVTLLTGAAPV